ncbi:hypothetical protein ACJVC5_06910 [Peredibacter sp. HCB2-198]|uniref:hypothetical protein n=1 Tax=Peredibacter sp. HCB2-198 TaxID=3383025 RepID=UPI0038B48C24
MKLALIVLTALLSTFAHADLAEVHQKNCQKSDVKELMGETGSCRIVVAPTKYTGSESGSCTGTFMDIPCSVSYITEESISALNITCGLDPRNPMMSQDMKATGSSYNVATIIKTSEGKDIIQNDETNYNVVSSNSLRLTITGETTTIALLFPAGDSYLNDVHCTK